MRRNLLVLQLPQQRARLSSAQVWAHHAFSAEFDANKPVKLRGNITKMDWINPHAWLHIDVKETAAS